MSNSVLIVRRFSKTGGDEDAITNLMTEYLQCAVAMMSRQHVIFEVSFARENVRESLEHYRQPLGRLLVAELRGTVIGVEALRSLAKNIVEIKKTYIQPARKCFEKENIEYFYKCMRLGDSLFYSVLRGILE
ncbi:MAG: hypothetical protein ACREBS_12130 [Nitrososphaerales archaeon]